MVNSSSKNFAMLRRPLPDQVELVVFDFDGVFTDNHVWVDENGRETVACDHGDGLGISLLREAGFQIAVGYSVAVSDAYPAIKKVADLILCTAGGHGAVRELCELLLDHRRTNHGANR